MIIAAIFFFASLIGIALLFFLKFWELRTQKVVAPEARSRFDEQALAIKERILRGRDALERLPPEMMRFTRAAIRESALSIAGLARVIERNAYRLADLVSHKRAFTRREQKNEFLNRVQGNNLEERNDL